MNPSKPPRDDASPKPDQASPQGQEWASAMRDFAAEDRRTVLEGLLYRLRGDFKLAMVSLFGVIAVIVISPFAIVRYIHGDWRILLLDLGIVVALVVGVVIAWRFGKSSWAGMLMAAIITTDAAVAALGLEISPMWALAVVGANFLLAPIWFAATLTAVLILLVGGHESAFANPAEQWTFMAVSVMIAGYSSVFSWRNKVRNRSLSFLAETDALTGLGNRRALRQDLTRLVNLNRQENQKLAVAMLDIDHFKKFNDEYGHEAGDSILEQLARVISHSTRESDHGYRFGGEEFVLILHGIDALALEFALAKLRKRIQEDLTSPGDPITVSIGATVIHPDDTIQTCLQRADKAMYKAKTGGRDKAEILLREKSEN